ncbi:hypothetical protein PENTCL1PPCAC_29834, partial [Pristionchus entomophagus]
MIRRLNKPVVLITILAISILSYAKVRSKSKTETLQQQLSSGTIHGILQNEILQSLTYEVVQSKLSQSISAEVTQNHVRMFETIHITLLVA